MRNTAEKVTFTGDLVELLRVKGSCLVGRGWSVPLGMQDAASVKRAAVFGLGREPEDWK